MGRTRSVLRGELSTFGLATLLTIVEMERRGGLLVLTRTTERHCELGRLHLREGRVVRARLEGRRRASGVNAVFELLSWEDGQFELWDPEADAPSPKAEIDHSISYLLMEGMRRMDEARVKGDGASVTV